MSRSRKKNPFMAITTADSEKEDKRFANRKFRKLCRHLTRLQSEYIPTRIREVSEYWDFSKDGKVNWSYSTWRDDEMMMIAYRK